MQRVGVGGQRDLVVVEGVPRAGDAACDARGTSSDACSNASSDACTDGRGGKVGGDFGVGLAHVGLAEMVLGHLGGDGGVGGGVVVEPLHLLHGEVGREVLEDVVEHVELGAVHELDDELLVEDVHEQPAGGALAVGADRELDMEEPHKAYSLEFGDEVFVGDVTEISHVREHHGTVLADVHH